MAQGPNAQQAEFWNSGPGQQWVTHADDFDAISREISDALVAACAPAPGEAVLDVGCGGGRSSFQLAEAVGPAGHVLGLDISEPLVGLARARRARLRVSNADFAVGDAETHRLEPGRRDLVASRFGMMFFADPVAAFRNIARALRPGGRMVFVAWAGPEGNPFFTLPQAAAVARLGPVDPVPPEAPGPMAFRDAPRVQRLLQAAGLTDVRADTVDAALHHPGGLEGLLAFVAHVGPVSRTLRDKGGTEADRAAIVAALRDAFARYVAPDGIRLPARVTYFSARTPTA